VEKERVTEFSNGDITIAWRPDRCTHAAKCVGTLPKVYKPGQKPWINPEHATTEELMAQIETCPSGALTYTKNK